MCLPYPGCPLAVLTRRGRFGRDFALDVVDEGGKLKEVEPMCDAAEFMIVLLERLGAEECALEDFKSDTSRSILYELFGYIVRSRRHCLVDACGITRDSSSSFQVRSAVCTRGESFRRHT